MEAVACQLTEAEVRDLLDVMERACHSITNAHRVMEMSEEMRKLRGRLPPVTGHYKKGAKYQGTQFEGEENA